MGGKTLEGKDDSPVQRWYGLRELIPATIQQWEPKKRVWGRDYYYPNPNPVRLILPYLQFATSLFIFLRLLRYFLLSASHNTLVKRLWCESCCRRMVPFIPTSCLRAASVWRQTQTAFLNFSTLVHFFFFFWCGECVFLRSVKRSKLMCAAAAECG